MKSKFYVFGKFPDLYKNDPDFHERFNKFAHKIDRNLPNPVETAPENVFALRRPGAGKVYRFDGIELRQKVGRWETACAKEFWEVDVKKGAAIHWEGMSEAWRLFWVDKGAVEVQVFGEEPFVAYGKDAALIRIPPFHPFSFRCVEDSHFFDLDCPDTLGSMLEDLGADCGTPLPQGEELERIKKRFNCTCTGYEYDPQ